MVVLILYERCAALDMLWVNLTLRQLRLLL